MRHYKLDGQRAIEVTDFGDWALWYETANRRVAFTQAGPVSISTVFLGVDQQMVPGAPPILFETKIFGGARDGERRHYATWDDAVRGHHDVAASFEGAQHASA